MRYALYPGCIVQTEQYGCELSVREVLPRLGVELINWDGKSCCGYHYYSVTHPLVWTYLTARNLGQTEQLGLDILTLCNKCYYSFCENQAKLERDEFLKDLINQILSIEEIIYNGKQEIFHLLDVLYDSIGIDKINKNIVKPFKNLKLASHPGCYAFRPSELRRPNDSENPTKLEKLIRALGAETYTYAEKLDCCGSSISVTNEEESLMIAGSKLIAVKNRGFDGLVTVCPLCFRIFDGKQHAIYNLIGDERVNIPVFYYTQLLGLTMDISPEKLGLHLNQSPVEEIISSVINN